MSSAGGFFDSVDLTNTILVLGFIAVIVKSVGEGRGWFRNAAALRIENTDLLRRNSELEATVVRHEATIREQGETIAGQGKQIARMEEQIKALEKLDQSAVLAALKDHEVGAEARHKTHVGLLTRVANALETPPN